MEYQPKSLGIRKKSTVLEKMGLPVNKERPYFATISSHNSATIPEQVQTMFDEGCKNVIVAYFLQEDIRTRKYDEVKSLDDLNEIKDKVASFLGRGNEIMLYPYETEGEKNIGRVSFDFGRVDGYDMAHLNLARAPTPTHQIFNKLDSDGKATREQDKKYEPCPYQAFQTEPFKSGLQQTGARNIDPEFERKSEQMRQLLSSKVMQDRFANIKSILAPLGIDTISFDFNLNKDNLEFTDWDTDHSKMRSIIDLFDPIITKDDDLQR